MSKVVKQLMISDIQAELGDCREVLVVDVSKIDGVTTNKWRMGLHKKQIRDDVDPDTVLDLIMSPIFQRFHTTVTPPDAAYVDKIFDMVLAGLTVRNEPAAKVAAE